MSNNILNYIQQDPISYIHVRDLLDRNYSIIYESINGFIIHDDDFDFTYMSFSDKNEMKNELSKKRYNHYIAYDQDIVDFYNDNDSVKTLHQFVYQSNNLFDIGKYDVRVLTNDYSSFIDSFYKPIASGETSLYSFNKKDVLGIFDNNKLAGIIGRHPEGCVGMLYVFEEYRRKGYAEVLEKSMINKLIKENKRVFCEVVDGNTVSMHLQKKLGYVKGDKKLFWLV